MLREPATAVPDGSATAGGPLVLVARSVDAGWIATFSLVSGAVVETGGDLSHGSILLRERGVPAITNTTGATREVRSGDLVELRAGSGTVELPRALARLIAASRVAGRGSIAAWRGAPTRPPDPTTDRASDGAGRRSPWRSPARRAPSGTA